MQGQRSAIGSLGGTLGFNHGSTSSDVGLDQQMCWNNLQSPAQNHLPGYMVSSDETNAPFFNPVSQERESAIGWSLGESSSSFPPNCVNRCEHKVDHGWSPGPSHFCNEQQYGPSDVLSLSNIEVSLNSNPLDNNTIFSQGSSSSIIPCDLNRNSVFEGHKDNVDDDNDNDCQVMDCTPFKSDRSNGYLMDNGDGRADSSLDGRRFCKRKALEGHLAQSSGSGCSNYIPVAENSLWHPVPAPHYSTTGAHISAPTDSNRSINLSEQVNPRLGLTMGGGDVTETPLGTPASRSEESSHRNFRVRINGSRGQDYLSSNLIPAVGDGRNVNLSPEQQLLEPLPNIPLDLGSLSAADCGNSQRPPFVMQVPSLHRSAQARWNSASSSRMGGSSSFPGERNSARFEEPNSRSVSRNISQHPMFTPPTDGRSSNQSPANWSLAGGNLSVAGNVASTSRNRSSSSGAHTSSSTRVLRRSSQYPQRLQELVRRSLLSSAGTETGGRSGNRLPLRLSSAVPQEVAPSGNHGYRPSGSRSAMLSEQHPMRNLSAAREGRSRLVTEIRNVLDLMRRGEGLRFEDVMMLDQSVFFGMPEIHDRHRDMRLDVDNMSYEELLALEERIGDVCTGLSEETILSHLKQRQYICIKTEELEDAEPCCICREEYSDGEDLGTLDCGHDFHSDCIKQWLRQKNLCPICKTTGLTT